MISFSHRDICVYPHSSPPRHSSIHAPCRMWETYLRGQIDYIAQRISAADGSAGTRRRVYTTGHSLGAVMAQYTAAAAQNAGLEVSGVYPFASPYTGGRDAWVYGDGPRSWIARYRSVKASTLLVSLWVTDYAWASASKPAPGLSMLCAINN